MKSVDIELSSRDLQPIRGFPSVAQKIASDIDKTTTIYRRFDQLSARNIILLQAELAELEPLQDRYDAEDCKRTEDTVVVDGQSDWLEFVKNATERDGNGRPIHPREKEKMNIAIKIREKLKEYCKHPFDEIAKNIANFKNNRRDTCSTQRSIEHYSSLQQHGASSSKLVLRQYGRDKRT
jgi:hypothetical protein